jgi:hypothetical protein
MALTFELPAAGEVSLSEFLRLVDETVDVRDHDSVMTLLPAFHALLSNKSAITLALNRDLSSWRTFQSDNNYSGQTFLLGKGTRQTFFLRANIWAPRSDPNRIKQWERDMFAYGIAHDHNFSFLTGGYFGSGYRTRTFEYDGDAAAGVFGEPAALVNREDTMLPQGRLMFFRESLDVHIQGYPDELSVSLNLMLPARGTKPQRYFEIADDDTAVFTRPTFALSDSMSAACKLALIFGDDETAWHAERAAKESADPNVCNMANALASRLR